MQTLMQRQRTCSAFAEAQMLAFTVPICAGGSTEKEPAEGARSDREC